MSRIIEGSKLNCSASASSSANNPNLPHMFSRFSDDGFRQNRIRTLCSILFSICTMSSLQPRTPHTCSYNCRRPG